MLVKSISKKKIGTKIMTFSIILVLYFVAVHSYNSLRMVQPGIYQRMILFGQQPYALKRPPLQLRNEYLYNRRAFETKPAVTKQPESSIRFSETATTWADVQNHAAWTKLKQFDCGDSAADRIIGGTNAALGQFPWIARLGYVDDEVGGEVQWLCGGALLTDRHVVTAAHCFKSPGYKLTTVRLGEYNVETNPDCVKETCAPAVQDRKVLRSKEHANFNNPLFHNDIALITLETPFNLNNYVSPICLPGKEQLGDPPFGDLVIAAGWGKTNMTTEEMATILQVVSLPIVTKDICNSLNAAFKPGPAVICAGAQLNKDACGGDSGGPLMKVFDTPEGPKNYLIGLVSFGPTICGIKKPGVYASVSYFLKWILDSLMET